ncbi:MAG: hypothetical protein Q9205_003475 [Flavoplaca limonia]
MAVNQMPAGIDNGMQLFFQEYNLPGLQRTSLTDEDIANMLQPLAEASEDYIVGSDGHRDRLNAVLIEYRRSCLLYFRKNHREASLLSKQPLTDVNDKLFFPDEFSELILLARWTGIDLRDPPEKLYFGKDELRIMIDDDMSRSDNLVMEVTEQFHLAWTLGCICSIRPASMAKTKRSAPERFQWKQVTISRELTQDGTFEGRFTAVIDFVMVKKKKMARKDNLSRKKFTIRSPRGPEDLIFSVPHRLLAILLRRGLLQDYTSVEDLFSGELSKITIKPEALDEPVFFSATRVGAGLTDVSALAGSFSIAMQLVATRCGFGNGTMYAFRRQSGTKLSRAVGPDRARLAMGHDPSSTELERHYDQGEYDLDVTGIALDEDYPAGGQAMQEDSRPALFRATIPKMGSDAHKSFVSAFLEHLKKVHPLVKGEDPERSRRWLYQANKAYAEYHRKLSEDRLTIEQVNQRREELATSSTLMENVREFMTYPSQAGEEEEDWSGFEDDDETSVSDAARSDDAYSEDEGSSSADEEQLLDNDKEQDVPYCALAKAFVRYLLKERKHPTDRHLCSRCQEDETVDEAHKSKLYSTSKLREHLDGGFHDFTPTFYRAAELRKGVVGSYTCPYANCGWESKRKRDLGQHLRTVAKSKKSDAHACEIRAAGWGKEESPMGEDRARIRRMHQDWVKRDKARTQQLELLRVQGIKRPRVDELVEPRNVKVKLPLGELSCWLGGPLRVPDSIMALASTEVPSADVTRLALDASLKDEPLKGMLLARTGQTLDGLESEIAKFDQCRKGRPLTTTIDEAFRDFQYLFHSTR